MDTILYDYSLNTTTWAYLSSLLMIAVFFKFNRVWSLRNLDLIGLIAFAPGLLLAIRPERPLQQLGYAWLFAVGACFLLRILLDPMLVRRPLLEPNLTPGGMAFMGASLLLFLMVNVLTYRPNEHDLAAARQVDRALSVPEEPATTDRGSADLDLRNRPGYFLMMWLPSVSTAAIMDAGAQPTDDVSRQAKQIAASRTTAILSHVFIVVGLILIGLRHFDNVRAGISAATLYLLLPYTAHMTGRVEHVVPAALLVWAVLLYQYPLASGVLIGLASGIIYYPLFLLPLWCGFYWKRGLIRFVSGVVVTWGVLIGVSAFLLNDVGDFLTSLSAMFGWKNFTSVSTEIGFWSSVESMQPYRIPVMAAFFVLCTGFALWPAPKNLGTLISCSAAVMLATQFWHLDGGGVYLAWYMPLLLLTIFRPNLEHRVAISSLGEAWLARRGLAWRTRAA